MQIEYRKISELKEYENNPRHNEEAVDYVAESIEKFGFKVPIIIDAHGEIIAGHTRKLASEKLGFDEVPVIVADDLDDEKIKAFRLADNKVAEFSEWDYEKLEAELSEILDTDMSEFGFDEMLQELESEDDDTVYTDKIETPVYEVTGDEPEIVELYDDAKTNDMITKINSSDVPEDVKEFLIKASYRHIKFDYSEIAEYYAHADKETQELMEDSALVIIDYGKAIEESYVTLSDKIDVMREEDAEV